MLEVVNPAMDTPGKSLNPNKHLKEEFVSNLTGSSMLELFLLATILPVLILLRHSISFNLAGRFTTRSSLKKNDNPVVASRDPEAYLVTIAVDFLSIVLPIIIFSTVLADWTYTNSILLILVLLFFS